MNKFREVILYGVLRSRFGRRFRFQLDTNTVAEAISALRSQLPGFTEFLANAKARGLGFSIFSGKDNLAEEQMRTPGHGPIRIAPIILGSKNGGLFSIILGGALIAASFFVGGPALSAYLLSTGIGMAASGLVQMLSPQPKGLKQADSPQNQPSYVFNGSVNTQAQGNPVPLLYGRMIVGSAVISAGIRAEDYAPASGGVSTGTPLGSFKKNFYDT